MRRRGALALMIAVLLTSCAGGGAAPASETLSGQELAVASNCVSCHTASGGRSVGPTWRSLAGSQVELEGGRIVVADEAYLTQSIREPQADIVAGYSVVLMPTFDLSNAEVEALVDYIESLGRRGGLVG